MVGLVKVKGIFWENCYFYVDETTKHGFLIDPGAQPEKLLRLIRDNDLIIEKILLTHGHFDHFGAVEEIRSSLKCEILAHENSDEYLLNPIMNLSLQCGAPMIIRNAKKFGNIIKLESNPDFQLQIIHTPGHTADSVTMYSSKDHLAFVGDTIFKSSIGESRYPGGNKKDLISSIANRILTLPPETILYSGHSQKTSVEAEQKFHGLT